MQEEDIQEFEGKKSSKEIWLFLVFIDIIALCVLGFFVYTSFFDSLNVSVSASAKDQPFLEEVLVEDVKVTPSKPAEKEEPVKAEPKAEPKKETPKQEVAVPAPKEAAPAAPEVKADTKPEQPAAPAVKPASFEPKKQSVFVSGTGKTRKVTFKYYGEAKSAAVVAGFTMRKPIAMKKSGKEWSTTVIIYPGEYRYMYVIDGKETVDPNAKEDGGKSVLIVK